MSLLLVCWTKIYLHIYFVLEVVFVNYLLKVSHQIYKNLMILIMREIPK